MRRRVLPRKRGRTTFYLYTKQDFVSETRRLTNGRGAQLVLDGVAKSTFSGDLEAVSLKGHIVVFGSASGPADPVLPNSLGAKSISLSGGSLGNFIATREDLVRRSGDVLRAIREGWLKLRIDRVLPLAYAGEAHRLLEGRKTMGKIVLKAAG
jgi:NADPH2:quinone reductase